MVVYKYKGALERKRKVLIQAPHAECQETMKKRRSENGREEKEQDESMFCST